MNMRTTLILAAIAVVGGLVMLFTPGRPSGAPDSEAGAETEKKRETTYVLGKKPSQDDIVRLLVERAGKPKLAFERSGVKDETGQFEPWRMTEPSSGATDTYTVQGVVSGITELPSERSFKPGAKDGVSAADAGLEPPQAIITLIGKDAKEYKVEIGRKVAMSNDSYVRVAGSDQIHQVTRDWSFDLKREAAEYRGKSPFKVARNFAQQVEVAFDGKSYDFAKGAGDEWVMNSPAKAYAAGEKIKALVNAFANLRVDKFVEDSPASLAAYGLDQPYLRIRIRTEEKKPKPASQPASASTQPVEPQFEMVTQTHELLVGGTSDISGTFRFVKLPDQAWVATAPVSSIEPLVPKDIRDARVTRAKAASASQLEITLAGAAASIALKDGKWTGEGDLADVDGDAVRGLLEAFEDLKAIDFVDAPEGAAKYGLDKPRATIRVSTSATVEPTTLLVGGATPSGRNTYVQVAGQTSVLVVTSEAAARLMLEPLALRSRLIFAYAPERIRRIEQNRGDMTVVLERGPGEGWTVASPEGAKPDPGGARDVPNDLALLRAKRVAGKGDFDAFGFNHPAATIRFTVGAPAPIPATQPAEPPPPPTEHTLVVAKSARGAFVRKDDEAYVFEIDESVFKSLTGEMLLRQLLDLDTKAIESIKIESNNGMVEFSQESGSWKYAPDPSVKLQQKKVADFAAELAHLRIEHYVAFGGADIASTLGDGAIVLSLRVKDASPVTLRIDQMKKGELPRLAGWVEQKRVFVLRPGDVDKIIRGLDYYCTEDPPVEPAETPGAPPARPGGAPRPGATSGRPGGSP